MCANAAVQTLLPEPVPVHHLGLFREKTTLQPVEYYNNLPTRVKPHDEANLVPCDLAIVVDPVIATGGTAEAAIQTLKEWGVPKVTLPPPVDYLSHPRTDQVGPGVRGFGGIDSGD